MRLLFFELYHKRSNMQGALHSANTYYGQQTGFLYDNPTTTTPHYLSSGDALNSSAELSPGNVRQNTT
jgi:hypothetical protein